MNQGRKRILVLHGWNSNPHDSWFPKVREIFGSKGFEVVIPSLPGDYFPQEKDWLEMIEEFEPDDNSILIGHSLGGVAILRYLEKIHHAVHQIILVAAPVEPMNFPQIENFFEKDFQWAKIRHNAHRINLIYEEFDEVVPLDHGKKIAQELDAHLEVLPGALHCFDLDAKLLERMINE